MGKAQKGNATAQMDSTKETDSGKISDVAQALFGMRQDLSEVDTVVDFFDEKIDIDNRIHNDFRKKYTIMFFQENCDEDGAELVLATYGLLKGFEYKTLNERVGAYWECAHEHNKYLQNVNRSGASIDALFRNVHRSIIKNLCHKLEDKKRKLGLAQRALEEVKKPESFDKDTHHLILPEPTRTISLNNKHVTDKGTKDKPNIAINSGINDDESNIPDDQNLEKSPKDGSNNERAESNDSEQPLEDNDKQVNFDDPELAPSLADELYNDFLELRSDNTYFEEIVEKLDYIPNCEDVKLKHRRKFCKLYIKRLIEENCKNEDDVEFLLVIYRLSSKFTKKKYRPVEARETAYWKTHKNDFSGEKKPTDNDIHESLLFRHKEILVYLSEKIAQKMHKNSGGLGLAPLVLDEFKKKDFNLRFTASSESLKFYSLIVFLAFLAFLVSIVTGAMEQRYLEDRKEESAVYDQKHNDYLSETQDTYESILSSWIKENDQP